MYDKELLLCDLDDTLWGFSSTWEHWLNNEYNCSMVPLTTYSWHMQNRYPMLTPEQLYAPLTLREFWNMVEPYEDAQRFIPMLQNKFAIKIVTATSYKTAMIKIPKLLKAFPTVSEHDIVLTHDKSIINGNILIDDCPDYLKDRTYPVLFTTKFNEDFANINGYIRVQNWNDIYNLLI